MSWLFSEYTPTAVIRDVRKQFDFLFRQHGYSVHNCYFDRFDYWGVLLVSHSENLGIWVSSERYVTLYLSLPVKRSAALEPKAVSIPETIALALGESNLRETCGYESAGRGIKKCAHFLKTHYLVLRRLAEQKNWLLDEASLEAKRGKPIVGHWKYEGSCWIRAGNE